MTIPVITFYQKDDPIDADFYPNVERISHLINPGAEVINVYDKDFLTPNNQQLFFIAPSSEDTFGTLNVNHFAELLMKYFHLGGVSHLYLLGADIGCDTAHKRSYAQQLANVLDKKGFHNLCVHTVSQPEPENALSLEIISYPSIYDTQVQAGFIHVNIGNRNFATAVHPVVFLNREENLFFPRENFETRQRRIEIDRKFRASLVQEVISTLETRFNHLFKKHKKEEARLLQNLMNDIKALTYPDFEIIKNLAKKAETNYVQGFLAGSFHNNLSSGTYLTLHALAQGKILNVNVVKESAKHFVALEQRFPSLLLTEPQRSSIQRDEPEPETSVHLAPSTPPPGISLLAPLQEPLLNNPITPPSANAFLKSTIDIEHLRDTLQREIASLTERCLSFLHRFEITTKTRKLCALESLLKEDSSQSRAEKAAEFLKDSRVMRSMKTDRTKALLQELCAHATPPLPRPALN